LLDPAEPGDGRGAVRVADKVESAQALDRQDFSLADQLSGFVQSAGKTAPGPRVL
jgi:hypothetical protein